MPPRAFYEVNQDSYIYKVNLTPEEKVRQWVLYELISTYMWPVNSIRIEYPLQIGSRNYRADVVVSDNSIPVVVIECKKRDQIYGERDQNQALSYADALKAQFAVWTNGIEWRTWRRRAQKWEICIDIPRFNDLHRKTSRDSSIDTLSNLLYSFSSLQALMYWLYRQVPKQEVDVFAKYLMIFLQSSTFEVHHSLYHTADQMTSLLWKSNFFTEREKDYGYADKKMRSMYKNIIEFMIAKGFSQLDIDKPKYMDSAEDALSWMLVDLEPLTATNPGLRGSEILFVNYVCSLTDYFLKSFQAKAHVAFETRHSNAVWDLVNEFLSQYEASLPHAHESRSIMSLIAAGQTIIQNEVEELFL